MHWKFIQMRWFYVNCQRTSKMKHTLYNVKDILNQVT